MEITRQECEAVIADTGVDLLDGMDMHQAVDRLLHAVSWAKGMIGQPIMTEDPVFKPTKAQDRAFTRISSGLDAAHVELLNGQDMGTLYHLEEQFNRVFGDGSFASVLEQIRLLERMAHERTKKGLAVKPIVRASAQDQAFLHETLLANLKPPRRRHALIAIAVMHVSDSSTLDATPRKDGMSPAVELGVWIARKSGVEIHSPLAMVETWRRFKPGQAQRAELPS